MLKLKVKIFNKRNLLGTLSFNNTVCDISVHTLPGIDGVTPGAYKFIRAKQLIDYDLIGQYGPYMLFFQSISNEKCIAVIQGGVRDKKQKFLPTEGSLRIDDSQIINLYTSIQLESGDVLLDIVEEKSTLVNTLLSTKASSNIPNMNYFGNTHDDHYSGLRRHFEDYRTKQSPISSNYFNNEDNRWFWYWMLNADHQGNDIFTPDSSTPANFGGFGGGDFSGSGAGGSWGDEQQPIEHVDVTKITSDAIAAPIVQNIQSENIQENIPQYVQEEVKAEHIQDQYPVQEIQAEHTQENLPEHVEEVLPVIVDPFGDNKNADIPPIGNVEDQNNIIIDNTPTENSVTDNTTIENDAPTSINDDNNYGNNDSTPGGTSY